MNEILILSGVSGSGKSTAVKALEDIDYYCVDNLPPALIKDFIDLYLDTEDIIGKVAIVIDIRIPDREVLKKFDTILREIKTRSLKVNLLFLDSDDRVLIRRFKETRRRHLLAKNGDITNAIAEERELLSELKGLADITVDTTDFNPHELRDFIQNKFGTGLRDLSLNFVSFGFKYGAPVDADLIIDIRFLPNPNYIPELKNLDGNSKKVEDYVQESRDTVEFMNKLADLLEFLLPRYKDEGKSYLNIAVGCTGGKHRSVVIINRLAERFSSYNPSVKHRDINRK